MVLKNKKGFFFTVSVILILGLFLASFSLYDEVKDKRAIHKRVDTMNGYLQSLEEDLSRQLYISGYRVVFLALSDIHSPPTHYIPDMDAFFAQSIADDGDVPDVMNGYTTQAMIDNMIENANQIGATVDLQNPVVTLSQDDPWNLKVTMTVDLLFEDESGIAKWDKKNHEIVAYIPITEFEDPVYYVETSGNFPNEIIKSETCQNPQSCDDNQLSDFVVSRKYIESPNRGSSFLDRLEGNLNHADPNGIESMVNLQSLELAVGAGNVYSDRSSVDYKYFGDVIGYTYTGSSPYPSWLKLDAQDQAFYGI